MVDKKIPQTADRLPIKLIMPNQGKQKKVPGGGSPPKPFRTVDDTFRNSLSVQITAAQKAVSPHIKEIGATPVRVKLIAKASAKSHRPENIFSDQTCPIVGAGRLGELFIKATSEGLSKLNDIVRNGQSDRIIKELSCIEAI